VILELDCGNTRVKWRVRNNKTIILRGIFPTHEGFSVATSEELAAANITRVLVGSVLGDEYARKLASWSLAYLHIQILP
jgi:type III pantothenate kinase